MMQPCRQAELANLAVATELLLYEHEDKIGYKIT